MYYIYEVDKPNKLQQLLTRIFKPVELEKNEIKINPITDEDEKTKLKIARKVVNILNNANSRKIVLSKNLKKQKSFINYLYGNNFDIVNGRFLFSLLAPEVLAYAIKIFKLKKEDVKISILANDLTDIVLGNINLIVRNYKDVTLVTRHVARLKRIQKRLYEEEGIVVAISNNKRKSLSKANIILNFDFPEELINKYSIYEKANIISFKNKIKVNKKRFNGSTIYGYEIKCKKEKLEDLVELNENLIHENYLKDIYDASLYRKTSFNLLRKRLKDDEIQIEYLVGNKNKY